MRRQRSSQSLSLPILAENCLTIVQPLHIFQQLFRYNGGMKEPDGIRYCLHFLQQRQLRCAASGMNRPV